MNLNTRMMWACACCAAIAVSGCSTANPFKKKSPAAPGATDLGYKPTQTVPTPGTATSVAGANTSPSTTAPGSSTVPGSSTAAPASYAAAPQTYPSTGVGATPIGAMATTGAAKPAGATEAAKWSPGSTPGAAPAATAWTPPASVAPAGGGTAPQEGYYNPSAYGGSSAPPTNVAAGTPSAFGAAAGLSPDRSAAAGNPFAAPTVSAGTTDPRTADRRAGQPADITPWTPGAGSPFTGVTTPNVDTTPPANEPWASTRGSATVGEDATKGAPRKDPHFRPGNTKDFQQNAPLTPTGAVAPPSSTSRTDVLPTGFSQLPDAPRRADKILAEAPLPLDDPSVPTGSGDVGSSSRFTGANAPLDGIPVSAGGPNANIWRR